MRLSWDGFSGYQRLSADAGGSDDGEPKGRYELAPASYAQSLPRVQEPHHPHQQQHQQRADAAPVYGDAQRWYYPSQQAVG